MENGAGVVAEVTGSTVVPAEPGPAVVTAADMVAGHVRAGYLVPGAPRQTAPVIPGAPRPAPARRTDAEQYPDDAVAAYRASLDRGAPLSARVVAARYFGGDGDKDGGNRRAAARMIAATMNGHHQ